MIGIDDYKVGMVVLFDVGTYTHIGVISEIIPCNDHMDCVIIQPSGLPRGRNLTHDAASETIIPLAADDARDLNVDSWKQRYEEWGITYRNKLFK